MQCKRAHVGMRPYGCSVIFELFNSVFHIEDMKNPNSIHYYLLFII